MSNYNTLKTADTINAISIVDGAITTSKLNASVTTLITSGSGPKVTAITYPGNDLAADPAGGQTITLTGTGFVSGCSVFVGTTQASVVTVVSATSVTFTAPALAAATYTLYLVNPDGGTATIVPGISYSGTPIWSTTAGTLGSVYEYSPISNATTATGDGSISYSVLSGTLPTGSSLNTSTGVITGTSPASAGATTYTFVIRATDAQLQDTDRTFSITINTDTVTWTTPAANSTVTLSQGLASTSTLLATSAAGKAITYTANALPTGMSISGATVTGTPTVVGNTTSTFTATAASTGRTTTAVINWTVSVVSDTYFPYTTLLLSGATATETFIADASTNNFALAIAGDTKPNNFNPYTPGYYSNYFDGNDDVIYVTESGGAFTFGTGDYEYSAWIFTTVSGSGQQTIFGRESTGNAQVPYIYIQPTTRQIGLYYSSVILSGTTAIAANRWYYITVSRVSGTSRIFVDGVLEASAADSANLTAAGKVAIGGQWTGNSVMFVGYISNARVVKGSGVTSVTVPTTPLTAIANTVLLTCQSNRFLDNSTNAFTITVAGNTTVNPTTPFVPNTTYATYGSTYFDGTGDYLSLASNSAFAFSTGDYTFECWINSSTTAQQVVFTSGGTGTNNFNFSFAPASGYIGVGTQAVWVLQATSLTLSIGVWYHVAASRSSGTLKLFLNGAQVASGADSTTWIQGGSLAIGNNAASGQYTTGYLTDVRVVKGTAVYTAAFTPPSTPLTAITNTSLLTCQTNQPANNSVFLDSSTNALAVTRAGNTSAGTFTPYGANWSNYFDGTGDNLVMNYNSALYLSGDFTIECWIYPTSSTGGQIINFAGGLNIAWASYEFKWNGNSVNFAGSSANAGYDIGSETGSTGKIGDVALNQWYHLAVTRSGNVYRGFLNGVQGYTQTLALTPYNPNARGLTIGSNYQTTWGVVGNIFDPFVGNISNVRIVKGTAVYTSAFTPSTTPLTAIANTVLLTCQSNRFVDNSTNAFAITKNGDVAVQRFSPFSPTAAYSTSTISGSAYFDGTGDYLLVGSTPGPITPLISTGAYMTIEAWVYATTLRAGNANDTHPSIVGLGAVYMNFGVANDIPRFMWYNGAITYLDSSIAITANTWNHIAVVFNGSGSSNLKIYVNGVLGGTGTFTNLTWSTVSGGNNLYIGAVGNNQATSCWPGYISNLRITNSALYTINFTPPSAPLTAVTNTSLLLNMTSAGVYDSTMINDLETVGDAKILSTQTPYAGSFYSNYFDGTGDVLSIPSPTTGFSFGTGEFTIEMWVYKTSAENDSLLDARSSPTATPWFLGIDGSNFPYLYDGTAYTSSVAVTLNSWSHVSVVRTSGVLKIFVNGVQGYSASYGTNLDRTAGLVIGDTIHAAAPLLGYISNLRIVKGTAVYTSAFTPPTAPLTAIANTNLLTCQSNRFLDNSTNAFTITRAGDTSVQSFNPFQRNSAATLYFDGTGDYLYSPPNTTYAMGSGDFTIEFWYYPVSQNAAWNPNIMGNYNTTWTTNKWAIHAPHSSAAGKYSFWVNNIATQPLLASTSNITNGAWVHIAITRSASTWRMFINGTTEATATSSAALDGGTAASMDGLYIGANFYSGEGGRYINAYINDLRITKGTARYTATFTPPTTAFITK